MKAIKIIDSIPFDIVDIEGTTLPPELAEQGYKLYDPSNTQPTAETTLTEEDRARFKTVVQVFVLDEESQTYTHRFEKQLDPQVITLNIESLKAELTKLDYLNSKNAEYAALGLPLPYSWQEIHDKKQPLRNAINGLEQSLNNI